MHTREELLLDLLERWQLAEAEHQPISLDRLCADCPELREDVERQIEACRHLEKLAGGVAGVPATRPPIEEPPFGDTTVPLALHQYRTTPPLTEGDSPPGPTEGIPGYVLLGELGRGGMGVVYRARQVGLGRVVALKMILAPDVRGGSSLARFRTEAEAIARLQHPNIVQVFEIGEHQGRPFFTLEFCPGGSLDRKLAGKPIDSQKAARLVEALARAMGAAHTANVIHRDLKPANVLLAEDGTPKVTDFGLARKLDELGQTQHGSVMGSPPYMPPEQARGDTESLGPSVDIYALGATLYECLTGRPPFLGQTVYDTLDQVLRDEPIPPSRLNPRVPRDLETICLKALHKDPQRRYPTAVALADDLRRFLEGRPVLARPTGRLERFAKWARRSPFQAVALAAGVAAVLATILALYGFAQASRRELAEQLRVDEVRDRFAGLYARAEKAAEVRQWAEVERDTASALNLLEGEPSLEHFPFRAPATRLLARAQGELADVRVRAEERGRLRALEAHHGDAVVFASDFTGMEVADSLERTRKAVAAGLAAFGITVESGGPPAIDPRFFSPAEAGRIADRCHELLLLEADALARPVAREPAEALRARLRQALTLIDRADEVLGKAGPTRGGLRRRARILVTLGEEGAAEAARLVAERTPPRLAADHFLEGLDYYRREEYAQAVEPLSIVLREQPDHYGAAYLLALCRLHQKQFQAGREGLDRCVQMRPTLAWPRLLRGYASIELGRWQEAREDFDEVLAKSPDEVAAYVARVNRGVLGLRQRDWSAALADLKSAVALHPTAPAAYINLALTHRQRAEVPPWQQGLLQLGGQGAFAVLAVAAHERLARHEAVAVLNDAVARCPWDARLHHERGRLRLLLGQRERARDDFARAVELGLTRGAAGTLADDLVELGRLLYQERRHEESVRAYQAALKVRPDTSAAWRLMAQPLLALRRHDEAGEALDRFAGTVVVTPGKAPTPAQAKTLAEVYKVRGLVHDEQARAFRERAALHLRQRDLRSALDSYTRGLALVRDPELLVLRGWTYLMSNSAELAQADFDEALRLRPGFGDARIGRANARVRLGQVAEALTDAEEGLKVGPPGARPLYNAARVHAQAAGLLRDPARRKTDADRSERRAVELLGQALERTPAGERAAFWKEQVQTDRAFDAIRRGGRMASLAARYGEPGR